MSAALPAQAALKKVSSVQPIDETSTMEQYVARTLQIPRSLTVMLNVLAAVGLALAIIGTYGSVWFTIRRSWRTLAVHLAVGGTPRTLMARSVASSMGTVSVGLVVGALLAITGGRLIESQLYGVRSTDLVVFAVTLSTVLCTAGVTALFASRRILSIDPAVILREEER
jgi:ABC-type antimicrobial peptide transport system permease subunit